MHAKRTVSLWTGLVALAILPQASAQTPLTAAPVAQDAAMAQSRQTAHFFELEEGLQRLAALRAQRDCGSTATLAELTQRQELLEGVEAASLDVDEVDAQLTNERGKLADLRTSLQSRRDATVARLNTAALITGAGLGAAVNATQFTPLSNRTNNIGDGIGVGSGIASTLLSVLATRKQKGPEGTVGHMPNMLAPLFDRPPVLNTYYPAPVLRFLESEPVNDTAAQGTRLEQLKARWGASGRLASVSTKGGREKVAALTSSGDEAVKVAIADLTDRIAMLTDVAGVVSLMKRDLAVLMRSYIGAPAACVTPHR